MDAAEENIDIRSVVQTAFPGPPNTKRGSDIVKAVSDEDRSFFEQLAQQDHGAAESSTTPTAWRQAVRPFGNCAYESLLTAALGRNTPVPDDGRMAQLVAKLKKAVCEYMMQAICGTALYNTPDEEANQGQHGITDYGGNMARHLFLTDTYEHEPDIEVE
ncbi:unnamed protein product, partial [Sphacelaria rigidula]